MYREFFLEIINMILNQEKSFEQLNSIFLNNVNCEEIYDMDDNLISDVYFALKHHLSGEENIDDREFQYFKECLKNERIYNLEEKLSIIIEQPFSQT